MAPSVDHGTGAAAAPSQGRRTGQTRTRVATAGLGGGMLIMAAFACWAALTTSAASRTASWAAALGDAYSQARSAVAAEESLERKYRLEPGPAVRAEHDAAAASLVRALALVGRRGRPDDRTVTNGLVVQHGFYVEAIHRLFVAVDDHDRALELQLDSGLVEPYFEQIKEAVNDGARGHDAEAAAAISSLRQTEHSVLIATPVAFTVGLALLAVFWSVLVGYRRDIERQAAENARLALHDALTGLPNRTLFGLRAAEAIDTARTSGGSVAMMLIDLDRFKEINDTLGHAYGDALLERIGPRLQASLGGYDTVARLGGDEFGVVLADAGDEAAAMAIGRRLVVALHEPFTIDGTVLDVEASIGIAVYPDHGEDPEVLLQRADVAMYVAKEEGVGCSPYTPQLDRHTPGRLALLGELRRALDQNELVVHYQPQAELAGGRVTGVEALVRWQHPERGLVPPNDFIPLAERSALIGPLTSFVLRNALAECRRWQQVGIRLSMAVNISARTLLDTQFPHEVARELARARVEPELLVLEITESTIMADPVRATRVLTALHDLGVRLSIDDFGTGYSSLAYLERLPVDELKIDRSFVTAMGAESGSAAIVRSTVDLARNLGLTVVAEGVEDVACWNRLRGFGCHAAQGYLLGRPVAGPALLASLPPGGRLETDTVRLVG